MNNNTTTTTTTFPCIESPLRVTLRCNGYYLWSKRNGKVIARKRRSEKDEFCLCYEEVEAAGVVRIKSHKFGGYLGVVVEDNGEKKPVFLKQEDQVVGGNNNTNNELMQTDKEVLGTNDHSSLLLEDETNAKAAASNNDPDSAEDKEEIGTGVSNDEDSEESDDEEDRTFANNNNNTADDDEDCTRWCLIKGDNDSGVVLQSLKTGDNLGLDSFGNVVLFQQQQHEQQSSSLLWSIDCVTGELCFLSNPMMDSRIRCDLAGLMTLSSNWKGWEVFRLMEAGHGYVDISSWMHSQWLLCSTLDGRVTACSHAEALNDDNEKGFCSKWAIEKSDIGTGVTSSKSHGRYLSINNGTLRTYHQNDEAINEKNEDETSNNREDASNKSSQDNEANTTDVTATAELENPDDGSIKLKWSSSLRRMRSSASTSMKKLQTSTSTSLRNLQSEINELQASAQKPVNHKTTTAGSESQIIDAVPERETILWNIEAAHLQTYYFSNITTTTTTHGEKPKSIGPFPNVTPNLRTTEKIQLLRTTTSTAGTSTTVTKLYNESTKQYVACTSKTGKIEYVDNFSDETTEWVMEKPPYQNGASVFRSRIHNLYLSYEDPPSSSLKNNESSNQENNQPDNNNNNNEGKNDTFKNMFQKKDDTAATLVGSETIGEREVW
eukprot:CAMPEP_0194229610 /NCGR_PEP_ID=MMETSP0156-20130528/43981_1 /TAXON_ID=33649 /ORGANISM="Thalassionema nitzschioides, Strain L26-B" /LENGTH=661 /DNA_ID=CAMNT_0038962167 /DNA_START=65 /DNA_END=2047 /DNA_ORIENTATION=+